MKQYTYPFIYRIRLRVSLWFFKMGRKLHPDISALIKQIEIQQNMMSKFIPLGSQSEQKGKE